MEVKCKLASFKFTEQMYELSRQVLSDSKWRNEHLFIGDNITKETHETIKVLKFNKCLMKKLPKNLGAMFPSVEILIILKSGLEEITKEDLGAFVKLKEIKIEDNELTMLPDDLFVDNPGITKLSFKGNKLIHIGPNILDTLTYIKRADFRDNIKIDARYMRVPGIGKEEMFTDKLFKRFEAIIKAFDVVPPKLCYGLERDMRQFLASDDFKNFTIESTNDRNFKVHKCLLAARSPTLYEAMVQEPAADSFSFVDISHQTFELILDYAYDEKFPHDCVDLTEVFDAAAKLKMYELQAFTVEKLMDQITDDNVVMILALANKNKIEPLKMKAFAHIRSLFPEKNLKNELADNPEAVRKLIAAKNEIEALVKA